MDNDSILPPRIISLRDDVTRRVSVFARQAHNNRCGSWVTDANPFARTVALYRAWRPGMSVAEVRAATLHELVALSDIRIYPGWHLAGEHLSAHQVVSPDDEHYRDQRHRLAEYGLEEDQIDELRNVLQRWHETTRGRTCASLGTQLFDRTPEQVSVHGQTIYHAIGWIENHSIRDYAKLIRVGFRGLQDEIDAVKSSLDIDDPAYIRAEQAWNAQRTVCNAGILLGERYADAALALAAEASSAEDKQRLLSMADTCRRVPAHGARTLFEAVQALWFGHILTCGEDGINANSIGRLDQMLQPWYEADLAEGRITKENAVELMQELGCKLYQDYDVQAITLAGRNAQGDDLTNDMTGIILKASASLEFVRDLSVRLHRNSPSWLYKKCATMISRGGGIPFLFNDECFIPALLEHGIQAEHVGDYAPIGCVELTIPGKANPHAVSGWFHLTKCLELALFDGVDPRSGERLGPATGDFEQCADFEAFFDAYCRQVEHFVKRMVYHIGRGELAQREGGPLPCWSLLTDDCIARGRDITDGGALYNYHSVCLLGVPNTADSLCALKTLVFENGDVSRTKLLEALRDNFEGHEALRQRLLRDAPKYGNDDNTVDTIAAEVASRFIDHMDRMRSPVGGHFVVHLFSFLANIRFGQGLGATPDGRRAGEPIAYSLSAQQGRDERGVTALLRSLSKLPHERAAGASAAIVDLDPVLVQGHDGVQRLVSLLQSAIAMGVGQLQFNVTTEERLRKAQEDPERYGNIPVRVAGYSQLFKLLNEDLQNHIIARTKHTA